MPFSEFVSVLIKPDHLLFFGIPSNFWTQWYLMVRKFAFITIRYLPLELIECLFDRGQRSYNLPDRWLFLYSLVIHLLSNSV